VYQGAKFLVVGFSPLAASRSIPRLILDHRLIGYWKVESNERLEEVVIVCEIGAERKADSVSSK
jgi:hypothetical protein